MTRIDFYISSAQEASDYFVFACRLIEKAYRNRHRVYVHTDDATTAAQVDDWLWRFRPNSFVPHHRLDDNGNPLSGDAVTDALPGGLHEVAVGHSENIGSHHDVLVNLSNNTPAFFSRFNRLAEVVHSDAAARERSRQRWRYYRDRGYALHTHNI